MATPGFANRLLRIDLGARSAKFEPIADELIDEWLGAKGLGLYFLSREVGPHIDPLGEQNKLILTTGPFQGSTISSAGRHAIMTKSPLTGLFIDSYQGGDFSHELKRANVDMLIVEGKSPAPVWVSIDEDGADVHDAKELWRRDTWETEDRIQAKLGEKASVISIGPAGERMVRFASPVSQKRRVAGRGGTGAVFGSKNLKALAARAKQPKKFEPANRDAYKPVWAATFQSLKGFRERKHPFYTYGTSSSSLLASSIDRLPTLNYAHGTWEKAATVDGTTIHDENDVKPSSCCHPCAIACEGVVHGKRDGVPAQTTRPEYETLAMLGANVGVADYRDVVQFNEFCNRMGLDTISMGGVAGFALEASAKGFFDGEVRVDGRRIHDPEAALWRFGHAASVKRILEKTANKEGAGQLLAEGVRRAGDALGGEARHFAVHGKGLEVPAWDPRGKLGSGLVYATADVGANHMRDEYKTKDNALKSALPLVPEIVKGQDLLAARDCYILCSFATMIAPHEPMRQLYNAITGKEKSPEQIQRHGAKTWTLARAFNCREGVTRKDDTLSGRLLRDPLPDGMAKGATAFQSDADMNACLDKYYELRGWGHDGVPTPETMRSFNLPIRV